ncbi:MAG TPA: NAD(P)-dependent oxidoreductase [Acidimicrobiales bacterium]|nr:NAD(P)-dependent oxidoreductase [Acidimicrobiales bacterium]
MPEPARIGFIGLGRMGAPMSLRLAAAGFDVVGFDVSTDAREHAAGLGLATVVALGQAGRAAGVVILMLPSSNEVEGVLSEPSLLQELQPGTVVVDMSSSQPWRTRNLAASLEARGIRMLDAPVSGGVAGAESGKLTIMVGGTASDLALARPYLDKLGRVVHAGPIGCGHAVKALNNLLSATHLWATSEAMLAGQRFGIEAEVMLSIFNASSGRSGSTDNKWPNFILSGTFDSGFGLALMVKDMSIAVELADQVGAPSALGSSALALWHRAAQDLPVSADHTEVARWLEREVSTHGH